MCQSLPAFYALTGCDSTSSISRRGKKKPWIALKRSADHQTTLSVFVQQQDLDETMARKTEAFIRDLYPKREGAQAPWTSCGTLCFASSKNVKMRYFHQLQTV